MSLRRRGALAATLVGIGLAAPACADRELPAGTVLSAEAQAGRRVVQLRGCLACHQETPSDTPGVSFARVWGRPVELTDGTVVTFDRAYLEQSLSDPGAATRAGAGAGSAMAAFDLDPAELDAVVAYLEALAGAPPDTGG
ncbi:MAG: c-type cytochrome [Acidimicrobiales bacterium]|nr:c-type cytochrome [Acidimicrobiales bacterium]